MADSAAPPQKSIIDHKYARKIMKSVLLKIAVLLAFCLLMCPSGSALAADPTTSVHIVKYAADGTTVVNETTVDYHWMEANLPVQGDGVTHYYLQGPVFNESMDKWDPEETTNFKDKGAMMGTDIKDLCELVGGMAANDTVVICAVDGYCVNFSYGNVYQPQYRQGPIVLSWYSVPNSSLGQNQAAGYPPQYFDAMQLVFMPKTANSEGLYVFGDWDMHECLPEEAQHFYSDLYPSTNGLSVRWVSDIAVYPQGATIASHATPTDTPKGSSTSKGDSLPWIIGVSAAAAAAAVFGIVYIQRRKRGHQEK
jgi:hypothetical protein